MKNCYVFILLFSLAFFSCGPRAVDWHQTVPSTLYYFQELNGTSLSGIRDSSFTTVEEISGNAFSAIRDIFQTAGIPVRALGTGIVPVTRNEVKSVWWFQTEKNALDQLFKKPLFASAVSSYKYEGFTIYQYNKPETGPVYAAQNGTTAIFSRTGFGVEEALRAATGAKKPLLENRIPESTHVFNLALLDRFLSEIKKTGPSAEETSLFARLPPVVMKQNTRDEAAGWQFDGNFLLPAETPGAGDYGLYAAPFSPALDKYIPAQHAAWIITGQKPALQNGNTKDTVGYFLSRNPETRLLLVTSLGEELAHVAISASGSSQTGESVIIRSVRDSVRFDKAIQQLYAAGMVFESGRGTWIVGSRTVSALLSGPFPADENFFLQQLPGAVVASRAESAVRTVADAFSRSKVLYYDENYLRRRPFWPEKISFAAGANSNRFFEFLSPGLNPNQRTDVLFRKASDFLLAGQRQGNSVNLSVFGFESSADGPETISDRWFFALDENETLTAPPHLADLKGTSRQEILFATSKGRVFGLAGDGSVIFSGSTAPEIPVGAPEIVDWYGNKTRTVVIAAGNHVYGWSPDGKMLPKFPLEVSGNITAPVLIADLNRDKQADAVIASDDGRLHALNTRGTPLFGWPQPLFSTVFAKPVFEQRQQDRFIHAIAGNVVQSWMANGTSADFSPVTLKASVNGNPLWYNSRLLVSGSDGNLYSLGEMLFEDSLSKGLPDSLYSGLQEIAVSEQPLTPGPSTVLYTFALNDSAKTNETGFLVQDASGAVFILAKDGSFRFAQSMGQPANEAQPPIAADLDGDGHAEILALAEFGRLFAWNALTQSRILDLPTSSMEFITVTDLENDGTVELIAKTADGVRCWSIKLRQPGSDTSFTSK